MVQATSKISQPQPNIITNAADLQAPKYFEEMLRAEILEASYQFENSVRLNDKEYLRALHLFAKNQSSEKNTHGLFKLLKKHRHKFKRGDQIDPSKIKPVLRIVDGSDSDLSEIFRLVRSMWSMPYNKGYGRRIRFVVYDAYHDAVIGIIGLQSPPADLASRDNLFDYPKEKKLDLVNCTMDAFTVGAIPPYSNLLGGKLCAGLISTDPVRQAYWRQYAGGTTLMDGKKIRQPLVAVTTTGAFGRSSMYNRLRYMDRVLAEPIGYTLGFGTLHLEHLYELICQFLSVAGLYKKGGYGSGPKIRWQNICVALQELGLSSNLLKHGVRREVFMFRLVDDLESGMKGGSFGSPITLSVRSYSEYWKSRWALPRAERFPDWTNAGYEDQLKHLLVGNK